MRLDVDFSQLWNAVRRMGADSIDVDLDITRTITAIDPIDLNLELGAEVDLSEIATGNGLLSCEGRQVLLYIQDHGRDVHDALEDGSKGRKFHVAYCRTLEEMDHKGKYERYVATNHLSGTFHITGVHWENGTSVKGSTSLKVCKNCLTKLNYQGYRHNRAKVFSAFNLETFFDTYSSFFPRMPRRRAGEFDGQYTRDWGDVAARYKTRLEFTCEICNVNLRGHEHLLHVHHVDGVKINNRRSNLKALCADCHRKQPNHGRMHVSHANTQQIAALRRRQNLSGTESWEEAFALADPGVHGVLHHCRNQGDEVPEVGYAVVDRRGEVVAQLDLAWPSRRRGIAISKQDLEAASAVGWDVKSMHVAVNPDLR